MKRQDKYPETETFHFHNANPKGRMGCDCVVRAISVFLDASWEETYKELAEVGIKRGYMPNDPKTYTDLLAMCGFSRRPQPRKEDNTKFTGEEFCREIARPGKTYVVSMANHLSVIKDCKVWDIWDCTGKTIGNYWEK